LIDDFRLNPLEPKGFFRPRIRCCRFL